jgi:hypothetical protein
MSGIEAPPEPSGSADSAHEENVSRRVPRASSPRARLVAVGVVGALVGAATIGVIWAATDDDAEPSAAPAPTSPADEPTVEATQPPPDTVVPATAAQPAVDESSPAVEPAPATDAPAEAAEPVAPADPAPTAPPLDLTPTAFVEPFDGEPAAAEPWNPDGWDVTVHSRGANTWSTLERMDAGHGPGCEPPPSTHTVSAYEDMVFQCRNHMMTSLNASEYGLIYVTPDHMVDFSSGEAVIQVDVSTLRGGLRDWWDIWITPFDANVQLTLDEDLPDLGGFPSEAIHIRQDNFDGKTVFIGEVISDFERVQLENDWALLDDFLVPDAARRDKFELRISADHIRFGMPAYDVWWIDTDIADLDWTSGVVQIGHHSYTPDKDCFDGPCGPNTWHWDNVVIDPAIPFTMIKADQRAVTTTGSAVNFAVAAPTDAFLRFSGHGTDIEIKTGTGDWEDAVVQESSDPSTEGFKSFWTPIPPGTTSVAFRGKELNNAPFHVRDIAIWSSAGP